MRERLHALVPSVEETMKWSMPAFLLDGKILVGMAAFKAHASVNFWRGAELGLQRDGSGMGQLGRLASIADLPADFDLLIVEAAKLCARPAQPRQLRPQAKPAPDIHPDLVTALDSNPQAKATFDAFSPSHRREYVEWVGEAKRDETRAKRVAQTIEWLAEGKSRNWKYERC